MSRSNDRRPANTIARSSPGQTQSSSLSIPLARLAVLTTPPFEAIRYEVNPIESHLCPGTPETRPWQSRAPQSPGTAQCPSPRAAQWPQTPAQSKQRMAQCGGHAHKQPWASAGGMRGLRQRTLVPVHVGTTLAANQLHFAAAQSSRIVKARLVVEAFHGFVVARRRRAALARDVGLDFGAGECACRAHEAQVGQAFLHGRGCGTRAV